MITPATWRFYWDLDGVLADYSTGMERFGFRVDRAVKLDLNRSGTGHPLKREMYEAIKGTDFYERLPIMPGAVEMFKDCLRLDPEPVILTAAPKFGADEDSYILNAFWQGAAYCKRRWVEEVFLPQVYAYHDRAYGLERRRVAERMRIDDMSFVCTTSARKWRHLHRKHGAHQVLVDDRIANVEAWAKAGGAGLLHIAPEITRVAISQLEDLANGLAIPDCLWHKGDLKGMLWKETTL